MLVLVDLPHPADYAAESYRVLRTFCGAGIGLLVMLLAGLLAKRTTKAPGNRNDRAPTRGPGVP